MTRRSRETRATYGVRALRSERGCAVQSLASRRLAELPLVRQPGIQFAQLRLRQVHQQLGEIQLRIKLVPAAGWSGWRGLPRCDRHAGCRRTKNSFCSTPYVSFRVHLHCYRWGPRHPSRKRSAPPSDSRCSSPHRPWDAAAAVALSKPAISGAVRPTRAPIASDELPGARLQTLPWPGSRWQRGYAAKPLLHERFPVSFCRRRQTFVWHVAYLDHQITLIIPTPALSRLGPPKALQRAKIARGCRDNASNFFWVRLVHTS